ncbi:MAG: tetratricopeptide repeat protein [Armatimonadetes bacterium]|nr:tetratricopeptide repeat protein [Armatimonadota bacterium]
MGTGDWFSEMGGGGDAWSKPQEGWLSAGTGPQAPPAPTAPGWGAGNGSQGGGSFASMVDEAIEETRKDFVPSDTGSVYAEAGGTVPVDDELLLPVHRAPRESPLKWFVALLLLLVVGAGAYFLVRKPEAPPPPKASASESPEDYFKTGIEAFNGGNYEKAAMDMEVALATLKMDPAREKDALRAREIMAHSSLKLEKFDRAEELYKELLRAYPNEAKYKKALAETRAAEVKANRARGEAVLKEARIAISNDEFQKSLTLGLEALELFENNQGTRPQLAQAHGVIGRSYTALGNSSKAAHHLRLAVDYDPSNSDYRNWLSQAAAGTAVYVAPEPERGTVVAPPKVPKAGSYPTNKGRPRPARPSGSRPTQPVAPPPPPPVRKPPPPRVTTTTKSGTKPPRKGGIPRNDDVLPSYRNSSGGDRLKTY